MIEQSGITLATTSKVAGTTVIVARTIGTHRRLLSNLAIRSLMNIIVVAHIVVLIVHHSCTLVVHRSIVMSYCRCGCGLVHVSIV